MLLVSQANSLRSIWVDIVSKTNIQPKPHFYSKDSILTVKILIFDDLVKTNFTEKSIDFNQFIIYWIKSIKMT